MKNIFVAFVIFVMLLIISSCNNPKTDLKLEANFCLWEYSGISDKSFMPLVLTNKEISIIQVSKTFNVKVFLPIMKIFKIDSNDLFKIFRVCNLYSLPNNSLKANLIYKVYIHNNKTVKIVELNKDEIADVVNKVSIISKNKYPEFQKKLQDLKKYLNI